MSKREGRKVKKYSAASAVRRILTDGTELTLLEIVALTTFLGVMTKKI